MIQALKRAMPTRVRIALRLVRHGSDATATRRMFREHQGRPLDLKEPKSLSEKISWLKLYGMTPLHSFCADKITAPAYVASRIGPGNVAERVFATYDLERIRPDYIERRACMVKTNHDSGGVFRVPDSDLENWEELRANLGTRMSRNFYWSWRERQYKSIRPGIVVEELLMPRQKSIVSDIRVYCFNGVAKFIRLTQFDVTHSAHTKVLGATFDLDWSLLPFGYPGDPMISPDAEADLHCPPELQEIIDQAQSLAAPFPFVRVDFLDSGDRFLVGELTFTPNAGMKSFQPLEADFALGVELDHSRPTERWQEYLDAAKRHVAECKIVA